VAPETITTTVNNRERIRYHETDTSGFAGERAALYLCDSGRSEFLSRLHELSEMLKESRLAFRTMTIHLHINADDCSYDDEIETSTDATINKDGKIKFEYLLTRIDDGMEFAYGYTEHILQQDGEKLSINKVKDLFEGLIG